MVMLENDPDSIPVAPLVPRVFFSSGSVADPVLYTHLPARYNILITITGGISCKPRQIADFGRALTAEEHSQSTREKYLRDAGTFVLWLGERPLARESVRRGRADIPPRSFLSNDLGIVRSSMDRH